MCRSRILWLVLLVLGAVALTQCAPAPRSGSTATATETATVVISPTETPAPSPTPQPTATAAFTLVVPSVATAIVGATVMPSGGTPPTRAPVPSPTLTSPIVVELKYQVLNRFPNIFFCDPDLYPVAHEVSDQEIANRVAVLAQNPAEYQAILKHLGLTGATTLSAAQRRQIDGERKRLNAVQLQPAGQAYAFGLRTAEQTRGLAIQGVINSNGTITVTQQQPTITTCPICLAGSTLIDTPQGAVPVRDLREGMPVWTVDRAGVRQPSVIIKTVRRPVPVDSPVVHLVLDDGRQVLVSAAHPTLDGRRIGDLAVGDVLDGARVMRMELMPLPDGATFDLLPAGETGAYWANGVLLASTLKP